MFCDEADIKTTGGNGGNGLISFRRERCIARGGPDGGDGGRGGDVIFAVNTNLNTLSGFHTKKHFHAKNGGDGERQRRHGKNGSDLVLEVPIGTVVSYIDCNGSTPNNNGNPSVDFYYRDQRVTLASGGKGGFGNAHFASSTRQAPRFAELGEEGEKYQLHLELKLVADVGIIGYPSVGKSTLISRISAARPKIAAYPFTTLVPNLGVVRGKGYEFVACDVPGLIEGASHGKGLGDKFLRHIERCRILVHLLDVTSPDVAKQARQLNKELKLFSATMVKKPQLYALNKIDTLSAAESKKLTSALEKKLKVKIIPISAVSGKGIEVLLRCLAGLLQKYPRPPVPAAPDPACKIIRPHAHPSTHDFKITKEHGGWRIHGKRIEQIAAMTDWNNEEAVSRVYNILTRINALRKLEAAGANPGDQIFIGKNRIPYHPPD